MLIDTYIRMECEYRPRSFTGLMVLYESNFARLHQLAPALNALDGCLISRVQGDADLYFELIDRSAHTSTLRLSYLFESAVGGAEEDHGVTVRVYHDARQAEALPSARGPRPAAAPHRRRELNERWQRNIMLNKWLEYLVESGHMFAGLEIEEPRTRDQFL